MSVEIKCYPSANQQGIFWNGIKCYPLSYSQKAIWNTEKAYPGTSIRNIAATLRIKGNVDYDILQSAINLFIKKNDATRIRIIEIEGHPMQYISDYKYHELNFFDFINKDISELYKWDEEQAKIPFQLLDGELIHFDMIKISENDGGLFVRIHHLIADAWTMSIIGNQILEYYYKLKNGENISEEKNLSYIEYIAYEEEYLNSDRFAKDKAYWNKVFESFPGKTVIKNYNPMQISTKARRKTIQAPKKLTEKIYQYCEEYKTSPYVLFLAALAMYINRVTFTEDINLGTTTLNRANKREKEIVGMFSNIVPIRVNINRHMDFNTFVKIVTKETITMLKHQRYPYDLILKEVRKKHRRTDSIFDIVLIYQNAKLAKGQYSEQFLSRWHFNGYQPEALNISINDRENDGQLIIDYSYLVDLFNVKEIEFLNQHIINILWHALDNPKKEICKLNMLSEIERHKVLYKFNDFSSENVKRKIIYDILGDQLGKVPEKTKLYILDNDLNPVPISIAGELYLSDYCSMFMDVDESIVIQEPIINPFVPGEVMFRTGYLARWYPNGDIAMLGKTNPEAAIEDKKSSEILVNVMGTFTAEPIGDYISWWGNQFGYNLSLKFAGYNQIFQELLDPESQFSKNQDGFNIILIRFDDFIRNGDEPVKTKIDKLERVFEELKQAIINFKNHSPLILPVFPLSSDMDNAIQNKIKDFSLKIKEEFSSFQNIYILDLDGTAEMYGIEDGEVFDSVKDKEAHMPFTEAYYAALGTQLARKICALKKQQFKVIVLDCDNTLWKGVCGEQGVSGIKINRAYRELQEFMLRKYNEGMILAICSKNNEQDVIQVFNNNSGMVLSTEHISNWKVNWQEKSENIRAIAEELNLGLDSFIFMDDNPIECSKMVANCPEVLTLLLPADEDRIPLFLKHVWAFDRVNITNEDMLRSIMYSDEQKRKELQNTEMSLDDYLLNLGLRISMREINDNEISRASQLTHRTNQFNLSTRRRSEKEIRELINDSKIKCFVVEASDRFGEYGIIGLVILDEKKNSLYLDTFLLSCRILGRKVEEVVLAGIRRYAEKQGMAVIEAVLIKTEKNQPIMKFFDHLKWNSIENNGESIRYKILVSDLPENITHIDFYYNEEFEKISIEDIARNSKENFEFDHIAIAVSEIKETEEYYKLFEYSITDSIFDPMQNSYLSMCKSGKYIPVELVAPVNEESPSFNKLQIQGEVPYHLCYRVSSIDSFLEKIKNIEYVLISDPKPALLFNLQKVAFIMVKNVGLIEIVETQNSIDKQQNIKKYYDNIIRIIVSDIDSALNFYTILGYIKEKQIIDNKRNILTANIIGYSGEKIELISPLKIDIPEYDFFRRNGSGVYQILYGTAMPENYKKLAYNRKYIDIYKTEEKGETEYIDCDFCDIEIIKRTKHQEHLLPIMNFTGKRLLQLPIFNEINREIAAYQYPTNEIEERLVRIWEKVLRAERIGTINDFFELGGDSLSAINIIAEIYKEFNVELTLIDIFQASTITELAARIINSNKGEYEHILPVEKEEYYNLSSAQKRMFILHQMEDDPIVYNECQQLLIEGNLDKARLENAFCEFIDRHEVLRTGFELIEGKPVQKIYENVNFYIANIKANEDEVEIIKNKFIKPFNLKKPPLIRVKLIEIEEKKHILLLDIHHIIIDGTSFGILIKEVLSLYQGRKLEPVKIQYKDFAYWQNRLFQSQKMKKQEEYWVEQFKGEIPVLSMPSDHARPSLQSFDGSKEYFVLDKTIAVKLKELCEKTETTMFMLVFSIFNVLLQKYTGQEDIVIGMPVAGRTHSDIKNTMGLYINTLPVRTQPIAESIFTDYLQNVKETILKSLENQDYQYEQLIEKLNIPRDLSRNPIFDMLFVLQNMELPEMRTDGLKISQLKMDNGKSKLDLSLIAVEKDGEIEFVIEYCTALFESDTIKRLINHLNNIFKDVTDNPNKKIADIEILSDQEKYSLIFGFNNTFAEYPKDKTIHELFYEQVEKTPDNVAVVFEDKQLTYRELNQKANQLAILLRAKEVKPNTIVGIMVERSIEMIIGILAILKAGGAYLPIDPEYPEERIEYMLKDSAAEVLLTQEKLTKKVRLSSKIITIDDANIYSGNTKYLLNINKPSDLMYVIYTSGSTGRPKGVMIQHNNITNFIQGVINKVNIDTNDIILCLTTISFDIFVLETWLPLTKGIKIIFANREQQIDVDALNRVIIEHKVSVIQMTPSRMKALLDYPDFHQTLSNLKTIMIGGEALTSKVLSNLKNNTKARIYNMYGPTETAVWSSIKELTSEEIITLGEPIINTQLYVVNNDLQVQPINIPGELCITGNGVARGYWNKPELTEERFVQNPFIANSRIYKTGDLVKRLPNGDIVYIDRMDDQIKIRGFRIELSEIKNTLLEYEGIKDVVILANKGSFDSNFVLYLFFISDKMISDNQIKVYLNDKLPSYMIPHFIFRIDDFPTTPNGKLDKKALMDGINFSKNIENSTPINNIEEIILNCWKKKLNNDAIGVNDNFFDVGGDSLSIISIISELMSHNWALNIQTFYDFPTVRKMANRILVNNSDIVDIKNEQFPVIFNKFKQINNNIVLCENVLLTGATGYLGIHILAELLEQTKANIYCLIRGEEVRNRLVELLHYYFGSLYDGYIDKRIFCINGDVTLKNFGLPNYDYYNLGQKINLVIHTAANVKHQGFYSEFEKDNVFGTKQVVNFCIDFNAKLGYMSTESVSGDYVTKQKYPRPSFTENDFYIGQNYTENVYIRSKFEAESVVIKAMQSNIDAIIFRVGFITSRYSDGIFQKNIKDNNFYNIIRAIIEVGAIPGEILKEYIEFSPVDYCANGITKLVLREAAYGNVLHFYNPNSIQIGSLLSMMNTVLDKNIYVTKQLGFEAYLELLKKKNLNANAISFIANNFNFERMLLNDFYRVNMSSELTQNYIKQINFQWPEIDDIYLMKVLNLIKATNDSGVR
ncbi:amino acid adenylation domain-containing protein [Dehalobacter sp. DCM]|uniref:amino acid adenylation domain-containing protein n=1 Tax=Dehalobacter sp. DCM TaxID=2907827 RepID=UPI0030820EFA|nr:amino acid adenylation domain-containing protein [Dehalobacter sp. DCM]